MGTTRILQATLLALGIIKEITSRVSIRGHLDDGAVLDRDDIMFDLAKYFDLSQADPNTLSFKATQGTGQGSGTPIPNSIYTYKDTFNNLQYTAEKLTLIKYLDERSFMLFYDETTYLYQEMSPNATIASTFWNKTFKAFTSNDVTCQDAVLSPNKDEILIGCVTKMSFTGQKAMYLFRVDRLHGDIIQTEVRNITEQDVQFTNRMQIGIYNFPQEKQTESNFVIIYNQGKANQARTRAYASFFVYHVVLGELVYEDEYTFTFENPDNKFDVVYDLFEYNHVFLVSAAIQGLDTIQVVSCQFDLKETNLICSDKFHDTFIPKTRGFVAKVDISGFWAEYQFHEDLKGGDIVLYDIEGQFNTEGWKREIRRMSNVPARESEHHWIRRIEGSIDNIAIQWAALNNQPEGSNSYDIGSVLVSWTLNKAEAYDLYSIAVFGDNVFLASIEASDVYVRRYSTPFFWTKGHQINIENTNVITITATDKDNSAAIAANIYNLINPRTTPILDFNPPYLDVFGGSTFELPFTGKSWVSGNGLNFSVSYNDSHFFMTKVQQTGETDIAFRPIPPTNHYDKVMFGDGGAVTHNGNEYTYYTCQFYRHGGGVCDRTFVKKGQAGENIGNGVFSKHGIIGHWSVGKDGKTNIYVAGFSEGMATRQFNYAAESVGFTMDRDNNIFVAIANFGQSFVEVWKIDADLIESWHFYQNFTQNSVGLTEFCPGQIRADPQEPTVFHAMSHCQLKGNLHGIQRIVALSLKGYSSHLEGRSIALGSGSVREAGVIPHFCPMNNHHVVYVHGMNTKGEMVSEVYAVSKFSDFDRYYVDIQKAGFPYVDKFECFSDIQMYAIHGPDEDGLKTYGLFWGTHKYNNAKFINLIIRDLNSMKWNNMESYYTGDYIIHVGYQDIETQYFAATLVDPPRISTSVAPMPGYYESITPVQYTITATNGLQRAQINGTVYARKANETIGYSSRKKWISSTGWLDIESFTRIDGPVTKVSLASTGKQLALIDRKRSRGTMYAGENPTIFDYYRGDSEDGVGITLSEGGSGTFFFIQNHEILGASVKYGADTAFDFEKMTLIGGTAKLIFYHGKNGPNDMMSAFVTKGQKSRVDAHFPVPKRATKVRLSSAKDNRRFIGFSHDYFGDKTLTVYNIRYDADTEIITIDLLHEYFEVEDFDICSQGQVTYLYLVKVQSPLLESFEWQYNGKVWQETVERTLVPDHTKQYWLTNVAASAGNNVNHVVINTHGTVVFSGDMSIMQNKNTQLKRNNLGIIFGWMKYEKYQDYEGWEFFVNKDFFVQKAKRMSDNQSYMALVWKRTDTDGTLHTAIEIGLNKRGGEKSLLDHPVTFFDHPLYGSTVGVGTAEDTHPLEYYSIGNVQVFIPEDYENINFREFDVVIEGRYKQAVTVDALLSGDTPGPTPPSPNPPGPAYGYWPFIVVIGVLILAAIIWFIYARSKGEDEDQYRSVDPKTDSGVTDGQFETGLDPKEFAGGEFGSEVTENTENKLTKPTDHFVDPKDVIDEEKHYAKGGDDGEENLGFD